MTLLTIQSGVPIPEVDRRSKQPRRKYPLEDMAVGNFVFYPGSNPRSVSSYVSRVSRELGKFVTRGGFASQQDGKWTWLGTKLPAPTPGVEVFAGTGIWREA